MTLTIREIDRLRKACKPATFGRTRERELRKLLIAVDPAVAGHVEGEKRRARARTIAAEHRAAVEQLRDKPWLRTAALNALAQHIQFHPETARDAVELAWSAGWMSAWRESWARRAAGERFPRVEYPRYPETV